VHGLELNLASIGASEVVEKPFDVDELLNKVALAVYRAREAEPAPAAQLPTIGAEVPTTRERGVVLIVEHDRASLHQLDVSLSERGFIVVSMTRALSQLARLARALRPRAILLELASAGMPDAVHELRPAVEREPIALLIYARGPLGPSAPPDALAHATNDVLVAFVEQH
jgi:DNA-binding response OmpR family regulator